MLGCGLPPLLLLLPLVVMVMHEAGVDRDAGHCCWPGHSTCCCCLVCGAEQGTTGAIPPHPA
jgi:hypothetical protein